MLFGFHGVLRFVDAPGYLTPRASMSGYEADGCSGSIFTTQRYDADAAPVEENFVAALPAQCAVNAFANPDSRFGQGSVVIHIFLRRGRVVGAGILQRVA